MQQFARRVNRTRPLLASDFASKAPPAVVEKEEVKLAGLHATLRKLADRLAEMA